MLHNIKVYYVFYVYLKFFFHLLRPISIPLHALENRQRKNIYILNTPVCNFFLNHQQMHFKQTSSITMMLQDVWRDKQDTIRNLFTKSNSACAKQNLCHFIIVPMSTIVDSAQT